MPSRDDWITLVTLLERKTQEGQLRWTPLPSHSGGLVPILNAYEAEFAGAKYRLYEHELLPALGGGLGEALSGTMGGVLGARKQERVRLTVQQSIASPEVTAPNVPGLAQLLSAATRQVLDLDTLIRGLSR
jgi:hypothetical protein